jgi:hypothetical protein
VVGVLIMLGLSTGLFWALRRRADSSDQSESDLVDSSKG